VVDGGKARSAALPSNRLQHARSAGEKREWQAGEAYARVMLSGVYGGARGRDAGSAARQVNARQKANGNVPMQPSTPAVRAAEGGVRRDGERARQAGGE